MLYQVLSKKQSEVFAFIKKFIEKNEQSPSLEEIADALDLKSKGTITAHLSALEKKGYIKRISGAFRGIVLTDFESATVEMPIVTVDLPILGKVAAGDLIEAIEEQNETIKIPKRFVPSDNKEYFALEVKGDSMIDDGIYNGEIVIIESRDYANNGDLVVAKHQGKVTLKYFYNEGNYIKLVPRNETMLPIIIKDDLEEFSIVGVMRALTTRNALKS